MTAILSNSLTDLADRVKAANEAVVIAERTTAEKVIEAGWLLVLAKAQCAHGEWLPFLDRAGVYDRTARKWMQIANSGLEIGPVADLGIRGTLEFLSRWRMPTFDEAIFISDATFEGSYKEAQTVGRGIAYVWEDDLHRGYYNVGTAFGAITDDDSDEVVWTRRPMLPRLEIDGDRPIDTIIAWLTHEGLKNFPLPIMDWRVEYVSRRLPATVLFGLYSGTEAA